MNKLFLTATLLIAASAASADALAAKVRGVRVAEVQLESAEQHLVFPGITRAANHARVTFLVSGSLRALPLTLGQKVAKGDLLAELYNPQLLPAFNAADAQVNELDARINQLRKDLTSTRALNKAGALSDNDLEQLETQLVSLDASRNTAAAKRAEAEKLLGETELRAPYAAVVEELFVEQGEFIGAGQPVVGLSGEGVLEVEIKVPELVLPHLSAGDTVQVHLPFYKQLQLSGEIIELGRSTSGQGQLFPVVIALPATEGFNAGVTAEVRVEMTQEPQLTLPVRAVIDTGDGQTKVYVLRDGIVQQTAVTVVSLLGSKVTIAAGAVAAGAQVVVAGQHILADGDAVKVLK